MAKIYPFLSQETMDKTIYKIGFKRDLDSFIVDVIDKHRGESVSELDTEQLAKRFVKTRNIKRFDLISDTFDLEDIQMYIRFFLEVKPKNSI